MKRVFFVLLFLSSFFYSFAACDSYTFTANGCFLEIRCIQGLNSHIEASLHLTTLTYVDKASTRIELRDGVGTTFYFKITEAPAYANAAAFFAFVDPLRNACQAGGGAITASTSTIQLVEKCDDNSGTLTKFYYRHLYSGAGALSSVTIVNPLGAPYVPTGTIVDCGGGAIYQIDKELICLDITTDTIQAWHYTYRTDAGVLTYEIRRASDNAIQAGTIVPCTSSGCMSSNEQGVTEIINGTFTYAAATYHSISLVVYEGTATVTVGTGAPITIAAGTPGLAWSAKECELLAFNVVINATGGGSVRVAHIQ
jgi:hypothetical protein